MALVQSEPKDIKISIDQNDYSAMRGPCPEGFHIPSADEMMALFNMGYDMDAWSDEGEPIATYLKLIPAGDRFGYDGAQGSEGGSGYYRTCTSSSNDDNSAISLVFTEVHLAADEETQKTNGLSIRAFKDIPVVPTSSWEMLFDGSDYEDGAGIFWDETNGLISISNDGTNWITIADKNVGASEVYEFEGRYQGEYTDANMGYKFQWGNNYGFTSNPEVLYPEHTSSSQVDASNYGPSNLYASYVFILTDEDNWDSSNNANLRGGETGIIQYTIKDMQKVYMWKEPYTDYSAMRGPCPEGFHVPTSTELTNLLDAGYSCGAWINKNTSGDTTNLITRLKLPLAGYRLPHTTGNTSSQGSYGYYHCCDQKSDTQTQSLLISSTIYNPPANANQWKGQGMSIRPFKDTAVTPDNSWTTIYKGTGSSGVYWNSSLGLISVSGDGTTWYTIADKNLGATSVYNYGNTLSESNCGKYYQWGNNYGFPFTGSVTTSSTQVNASSYGPGNYYSSSTYITQQSSWDSPVNQNLRGAVTGTTQGGGDIQIRPEVIPPRTFTISRTEQSDMSSGWTYSDDAAGLTAGDGAFDDFFGYSAVLLNTSGVETAEMKQKGGVFSGAMTSLGNIISGDNVMIKFPIRGIKMTKSGSTVTLSITEELDKEGYQYYAFNRNGTRKNKFYLGAYKASKVTQNGTQYLRSYSGKSAAADEGGDGISYISFDNACTLAQKNSGYDVMTWYQRQYINAMYMMKYGNPNSQSVIGPGLTGGDSIQETGITNFVSTATGHTGSNSGTDRIKLFGLEDRWGNVFERMNGAYCNTYTNLQTSTTQAFTSGKINSFNANTTVQRQSPYYLKSIAGTNTGMFAGTDVTGSSSTYYCDQFFINRVNNGRLSAGGRWNVGDIGGAFFVSYGASSIPGPASGARLMFI